MEKKIKEIAYCIYCNDLEGFREALLSLPMGEDLYHPDDTDFKSSGTVALAFEASGLPEYVEYLKEIVNLRPKLLEAYRKGYGQPLFRQIFANGSEKSWDFYLNRATCMEKWKYLTKFLQDAREYHEKALDELQEIKSISFEKEIMTYLDETDEAFDLYDQYVQADPRDMFRQLNTIVRQRRMLKILAEKEQNAAAGI